MSDTTLYVVALDEIVWNDETQEYDIGDGMLLFMMDPDHPLAPRGFWSLGAAQAYEARKNAESFKGKDVGRVWRICHVAVASPTS